MSPITTLAACIEEVLLSSCSIFLALHLFLLLYVQFFCWKFLFIFYSLPWSMTYSDLSFPCSYSSLPLLKDLYSPLTFFLFLIRTSMQSTLSVFKMNVYQNVPLTKTYLQPSLSSLLSHNSCKTLHTCCFKFVSFGVSGSFLISIGFEKLFLCFCKSFLNFHSLMLFIVIPCPVDINDL